jgi:hypothetical protein
MQMCSPTLAMIVAASQAQASGGAPRVLAWVGVLIVLVLAGAVAVLLIRRRVLGSQGTGEGAESLMQSLRRLRDEGRMTPEEYEAARRSMAKRVSASMSQRAERRASKGS